MTVPNTLEGWNYEIIRQLVIEGYYETDTFDFKPVLTPRHQDQKKRDDYIQQLLNTVCAFANTYGGFIVFGIEDQKNKKGEDRIVGLDRTDLGAEFGDKIKNIDPTVYYTFKNPPIKTHDKDKVIFVVHIPRSMTRPHMVSTGRFYYRTNRGNNIMNYNEVKGEFLAYEERRYKLDLFFIEIINNLKIAEKMVEHTNKNRDPKESYLHFSPLKFETDLMNNLLPDIFGIIQTDQGLAKDISTLRLQMGPVNTKISTFLQSATNLEQMKFQLETHNEYIKKYVGNHTLPLLNKIRQVLVSKYGLSSPISDSEIF
ncbi:MAG: ATP-binding protein [Candidatus Nitrosopolaris sp.]